MSGDSKIFKTRGRFLGDPPDYWVEVSPTEWDFADKREILFHGKGQGVVFVIPYKGE